MRELKFRAWDEKEKCWVSGFAIHQSGMFSDWAGCKKVNGQCIADANWQYPQEIPHIKIMQYTGLKDRNGREIYEGDILLLHQFLFDGHEFENELIGEVVYDQETCSFALRNIRNADVKKYMGYREHEDCGNIPIFNFYGLHEESFEKLGNIYENHERDMTNDKKAPLWQKSKKMTEQQTPDREKKIAEIREALEKATPGPWKWIDPGGLEKKKLVGEWEIMNFGVGGSYSQSAGIEPDDNDAHLIANAPKWLGFLLDELERLEREYALERAAHNAHVTELCQLEEENRKLRERLKEEIVWQDECLKLEEQLQSAQQEIERLREELNAYKPSAEVFYELLKKVDEERQKLIDGLLTIMGIASEDGVHWKLDRCYTTARDILKEVGVLSK